MKKFFSKVICLLLLLAMTACAQPNKNTENADSNSTKNTAVSTAKATTTKTTTTSSKTTSTSSLDDKNIFLLKKTDKGYAVKLSDKNVDIVYIDNKLIENKETELNLFNSFETINLIPTEEKFDDSNYIELNFVVISRERGIVLRIDKNNNIHSGNIWDEVDLQKVYKMENQKLKYEDLLKLKIK